MTQQMEEAAIRQSEARYRALTELSPQIVYLSDPNGSIQYCNQWGLDFTGRSLEELQGYGWSDLIHPDYRDRTYTAWTNTMQGNGEYKLEVPYLRADGQYRWLYTHASPVRDERGEIEYWIGIALDVHDRKEAELAVRRQEAEFRLLAESLPQIVWVTDADGKISYVNERWIEFSGLSLEETATPEIHQTVIHSDDQARVHKQWSIALEQRSTYRVEARMRNHRTGEFHWFLIRAEPFKDEAGNILRWFGTSTDITETKRREQQVAFLAEISQELTIERTESDMMQVLGEKIGKFLNLSNCAFVMFDSSIETAIVYDDWRKDPTSVSLAGEYSMAEFAPMAFWEQMSNGQSVVVNDVDTDPRMSAFAERYHAIEIGAFVDAPFVSDHGIQFAIALHHPHPYQWRTDEIGLAQQLTTRIWAYLERDRALQQLRAAREAAEQANRMKDEFLAVLSHELRSPLNPILGWTKILRSGNLNPERTAHALETIERNAQLQSELIEDLLDVARILQGKLSLTARPINVVMMIQSAIETVRLAAESKQIAIEMQLSEVGEVSGDATRLQQIVWNLLSNAVKFTPQGGRVTVRLKSIDHQAQITITDTGKGISPNFLPHVFEYFRQEDGATTRKFGGLGLGLAIVRHLVELHGGTVTATSEGEGLGATFTVMLPLINVQPKISKPIEQTNLNDLSGMRLLVVDDEPDSREFIAFVLEQAGAEVTIAASGAEVLLQVTHFDVLVSDIGMPGMDGYMLIRQIRKQGGTINAIALTAYAGEFNQQQALEAGFQAHLAKPIDPDRLVQEVAKFRL